MTYLAFLLPLLFFVSLPSRMWNFDGVACAAALELGNPAFLFHSNHLLYGFLGFLFWQPLSSVLPRALPALQLFTSVLSAAGLVGLYLTLRSVLAKRELALLLTLGISVSAVVWVWSIEAQVYALAFLALSWATHELLKPAYPGQWRRVGWLHAGAVLGHIVHVLWIVPVLYWMGKDDRSARRQHLQHYLVPLVLGTVVPYLLVIGWMVAYRETRGPWLMRWLMGSFALNPTSVFQWHFSGWTGPFQWVAVTPRLFWGTFWPYHVPVAAWCWIVTGVSVLVTVGLLGLSWSQHRSRRWLFSVIWLAVYGVFFWTWEPTTECYRMTDLIPLAILLALGVTSLKTHPQRWTALALFFATLLPVNVATRIEPMHQPEQNPLYQETLALQRTTPDASLYLTAGGSPWIYLLYFTGRSAWNLRSLMRDPQRLSSEITRSRSQRPVFIRTDALQLDGLQPCLSHVKLRAVDSLPWMQIQ